MHFYLLGTSVATHLILPRGRSRLLPDKEAGAAEAGGTAGSGHGSASLTSLSEDLAEETLSQLCTDLCVRYTKE